MRKRVAVVCCGLLSIDDGLFEVVVCRRVDKIERGWIVRVDVDRARSHSHHKVGVWACVGKQE